MAAATSIAKNKDGVPIWDGTPSSFEEYSEQCMIYEQSTPFQKRYLVGPRLLGELQGAAKRHIAGQPATWLSDNQGVQNLLRHLRACLGKPQIPELTEHLNRYFRQGRRKPQESMNEYISRKCEIYLRACQAMARVAPHHRGITKDNAKEPRASVPEQRDQWTGYGSWPERSRRSSWDSQATDEDGAEAPPPAPVQAAAPIPNSNQSETTASEAGRSQEPAESWTWTGSPWWYTAGWYGYGWNTMNYGYATWWKDDASSQAGSTEAKVLPELLPEFVQGWYLLQDAGLSAGERNMVLTAIQNDFSVQRVAQELRTQFIDIEHRRHEGNSRQAGYWGDIPEDDDEEEAPIEDGFSVDDLTEEGQVLWAEAETDVQQAWVAVQTARRTLKDARARQSAVKLSRKYYQPGKGYGKGGSSRPREDIQCLKCGRRGHKAQDCRSGGGSSTSTTSATQSAPFVCYVEQAMSAQPQSEAALWSTQEAVREGYAVVDGGATRTLGSIEAIQHVMKLNSQKHGDNRVISVNPNDRPTFGFGNATEDRCASTVELGITAGQRQGQLTTHALDRGETPILLSVSTLRALEAVIDFREDLVCFRAIDQNKVLKMERSNTGHQLLSLTDDLYQKALRTRNPIPSLREFVQRDSE